MVPMNVAVVPHSQKPTQPDITKVTAALQIQVTRDFAPIWGVTATVTPFSSFDAIPPGYMALVLVDELPRDRHGVHYETGGRPFGLVRYGDSWSLMASHELLEMLVDPWGNRVLPGRSLKDGQGQVEYLMEICDPCQTIWYLIDGVLVSDFVTPDFYASQWTANLRYSFTGKIDRPREVTSGGYITWRVPGAEEIWQSFGSGPPQQLRTENVLAALSFRGYVDSRVDSPTVPDDAPFLSGTDLERAAAAYADAAAAARRYGGALKRDIDQIVQIGRKDPHAQGGRYGINALLRDLGEDKELWEKYKRDTHAVLQQYGIATQRMPATAPHLADQCVFQWISRRVSAGADVFGDPACLPGGALWWLAALGGG